MEVLQSLTMAVWQTGDETIQHDHHLVVIFIGIVALAMLVQAIAVLVGMIGGVAALKKIQGLVHELHQMTMPVIADTHALVKNVSPKVSSIATNVEVISETLRAKTEEVGETVSELNVTVQEVNLRARVHVAHADRIVTSTLNTTEEIKDTVASGIRVPLKQITGIIAGLRAGIDSLLGKAGRRY